MNSAPNLGQLLKQRIRENEAREKELLDYLRSVFGEEVVVSCSLVAVDRRGVSFPVYDFTLTPDKDESGKVIGHTLSVDSNVTLKIIFKGGKEVSFIYSPLGFLRATF